MLGRTSSGSGKRPLLETVNSEGRLCSANGSQSSNVSTSHVGFRVEQCAPHSSGAFCDGTRCRSALIARCRFAVKKLLKLVGPFGVTSRDALVHRSDSEQIVAGGPKEAAACSDGQRHLQHEI